jgi:Fe2+ or Zn2+ uptake regulation protein
MSASTNDRKEQNLSGLRLTPQRRAILRALQSSVEHPDAVWVYEQVRRELPRVSLGTVYRNLAQLHEAGLVIELDIGRARRWDGRVTPHEHIVCQCCGAVQDLDILRGRDRLEDMAARSSGFLVRSYQLHFEGLCPHCQHNNALDVDPDTAMPGSRGGVNTSA